MTRVVISQPTYLPWLGYFELIRRADVFVLLDNVQFSRRSWQCRNRLKGPNGEPFWLTVPVSHGDRDTELREIRISPNHDGWAESHLRSIHAALGRAPYFHALMGPVETLLRRPHARLVDLNGAGIAVLAGLLGISTPQVLASELGVSGQRSELLLRLCQRLGADVYYSPHGSSDYLDEDKHMFQDAGIRVEYQTWEHPVYPQRGGGFISHLSALDAVANVGPETARSFLG